MPLGSTEIDVTLNLLAQLGKAPVMFLIVMLPSLSDGNASTGIVKGIASYKTGVAFLL